MRIAQWVPGGLVVLIAAAMLWHGPIAQPAHYHEFADDRTFLGLPNAADVLSNIGFALVGLWGFGALRDQHHHPLLASSWPGYRLFLAALVLTALGSGFYHLAPDNARLLWDRLPIALACVGLLAGVHAETHESPQPRWTLAALAAVAVLSVLWWSITEHLGAGDLRPYLMIQGAPLVLIPLWQAIHGSPRADRVAFGIAILLYVLAKVAELDDRAVFEALGFASGHTIKHLLATAASAVLAANLVRRVRPHPAFTG
ncbi:MAG: alkaline phytoceramidase [Usitatibacter sp.]